MIVIENSRKYRTLAKALRTRADIKAFLTSTKPMSEIFFFDLGIDKCRVEEYKQLYIGNENTGCYTINLPNDNILQIKLEYCNSLGNNHYARYWIPYLYLAEGFGIIEPGKTEILEVTSGSAGISLAMACENLGYDLSLIVPSDLPTNRTKPMSDSGAKLIRVDGYIDRCIEKFKELLETENYFAPNHSEEVSNLAVHTFSRMASEFFNQYGSPDYLILGLGNGTTTEACFRYFQHFTEKPKLYAYHPSINNEQTIFGLYSQPVKMRHVENALSLADRTFQTNDFELNRINHYFGYDSVISWLGASSLYGIEIALMISEFVSGKTFLTIGYDTYNRY